MAEMNVTSEALPTQGGSYPAYKPEWFSGDESISKDGWVGISVTTFEGLGGIPAHTGLHTSGINQTVRMYTYAQAMALAWQFAAWHEAKHGSPPRVRVAGYMVHYDIKCYRETGTEGHPHAQ